MKVFAIGDIVWVPQCGTVQVEKVCPICYGKRKVTLILGNDDRVELDCDYCAKGYEAPTGIEISWEYVAKADPRTITAIEITETVSGTKYCYRSNSWAMDEEKVFATQEEAEAACVAIAAQYERDQFTRMENIKKSVSKSYAWNAGYHMREAKRNKRDMEYHERKAQLCAARSKTGEDGK